MTIRVTIDQKIMHIVIDRPDRRNAFTNDMYKRMADALQQADNNKDVRVVLISGHESVYSSGNDLHDFLDEPPRNESAPAFQFLRNLSQLKKPIVACVRGPAIGVGTSMLFHCDLVYAGEQSSFATPFAKLGLCPEAASSYLLPLIAGFQRASEMLMFGDTITAQRAQEMGFVNEVKPDDQVLNHAKERALKLSQLPPESLRLTKRLMKMAHGSQTLQQILVEASSFFTQLESAEAKEAFNAFFEKRPPDFSQFD
jgi:enoyl-CoA hydratase/carnithine racemase